MQKTRPVIVLLSTPVIFWLILTLFVTGNNDTPWRAGNANELTGDNSAWPATGRDLKVRRGQVGDWLAILVEDDHVHHNKIDPGPEHGRSLLGGRQDEAPDRDGCPQAHDRILS